MKNICCFLILIFVFHYDNHGQNESKKVDYVMVIHGGAGNFNSAEFSPEKYTEYENMLNAVLLTGDSLLKNGVDAVTVVEKCIRMMEDSPLFNSGRGAVLNEEGIAELDASIMDGKTRSAGAVAGVHCIKNPISAARKVMDDGRHVMLTGEGAETFAKQNGVDIVDPSYFITNEMHDRYLQIKQEGKGTVGVVVLDMNGNLAAGTSTGGMMMKRFGRIGDSPIIGAGTYADNDWCAVSCTGHGEYFIRFVAAYDVVALMKYSGLTLEAAATSVIENIATHGGTGGLIAVDKNGNIAMPFSTQSMFRAYIVSDGQKTIQF